MPDGQEEQKQTWQLVSALKSTVPQSNYQRDWQLQTLENKAYIFTWEITHTAQRKHIIRKGLRGPQNR
jgi:hypothetical protein